MYLGIVYDAIYKLFESPRRLVLDQSIRPLDDSSIMFGKVFTTKGELVPKEDYKKWDEIRLDIPEAITDESVVLLEAGNSVVAHAGDISLLMYQEAGIEGFLTDGYVRDSRIIKYDMKFPCFCRGALPIDAINHWALTEYATPIHFKDVDGNYLTVYNGDLIYADSDGAIVIPQDMAKETMELVHELLERENHVRKEMKQGISATAIYQGYGRW